MGPAHPDHEGLQVRPLENYPEVVYYSDKEVLPDRISHRPERRACRLSRRVFVAFMVIIVLPVVGGGVWLVIAAKKSESPSTYEFWIFPDDPLY